MDEFFTIFKWCLLLIAIPVIKLTLLGITIYIAYLAIKALKIYIKKNQEPDSKKYRQYYEAEKELNDLEAEINSKAGTDWSKEP